MESFRKLISRFRSGSKSGRGKLTVTAVVTRSNGTVEDLGIVTKGFIKDWETARKNISGGN